ncbi:MAG: hypothetical protein K2I14_00125 [Eubacterium sp.]|nr:hypothetical protein [Eubacterium sp.]
MSEEFEKLDSPLVVHKESDASYLETANIDVMSTSGKTDENKTNLVRHRFKKTKKKSKLPYVILLLVIIVSVVCALYFSGVIGNREENTTENTTNKTYAEVTENRFEGVITVKGTYIFFEGEEIDDMAALERILKYLDTDTTYVIQDEEADSVLLTQEIIPLLDKYGIKHGEPTFIISSGLKSKYEKAAETSSSASESTSAAN